MSKLKFSIVDVFAEERFTGNQLAVFHDAGHISDDRMQQIAREMNYSETTFILSSKKKDNGYDVRIFTPNEEVPFAGHPTLGTAYVIQKEIIRKPVKKIKLNLLVGQIPVSIKYKGERMERLWMKQNEPEFGRTFEVSQISGVLNLSEQSIDTRFPVQEVSTGLPFILVPLKTLKDVKSAVLNREKYNELIENSTAKAMFIFCPETYEEESDFNARMFADYYGISEDPATGSANGCLAGYLVKHRYLGADSINVTVEQGFEIMRPSHIYLRAEDRGNGIDIQVGGKTVMAAKGELV